MLPFENGLFALKKIVLEGQWKGDADEVALN